MGIASAILACGAGAASRVPCCRPRIGITSERPAACRASTTCHYSVSSPALWLKRFRNNHNLFPEVTWGKILVCSL